MSKERRKIVLDAKTQILTAIRLRVEVNIYENIIKEAIDKALKLTAVGRTLPFEPLQMQKAIDYLEGEQDSLKDAYKKENKTVYSQWFLEVTRALIVLRKR